MYNLLSYLYKSYKYFKVYNHYIVFFLLILLFTHIVTYYKRLQNNYNIEFLRFYGIYEIIFK